MKKILIAIVDDHVMVRNGLEYIISEISEFELILIAENGKDFLNKLQNSQVPDVVLLDIDMPVLNGFETAEILNLNYPECKILFISSHTRELFIEKSIKIKGCGYISKSSSSDELKEAIYEVYSKGFFF